MINPDKLFGRLGNRMFQMAFAVAHAKDHDMDYYYQDEFFFRGHENLIRALYSTGIESPINKVAIHVRRGDYVGNKFHISLSDTDYYDRAIRYFPNDDFIVFSDDIDWCLKKWAADSRFTFSSGDELEDLNRMAACKGHIIANSSFSWWGAWLSPRFPDNKVVAPEKWFHDGIERTFCPKHWIKI